MAKLGDEGFSLLEALVALSLMALTLASVYGVFTTGLTGGDQSVDTVIAVRLAQAKLSAWQTGDDYGANDDEGITADGFRWRREISRPPADPVQDAILPSAMVTIHVSWRSSGKPHTYRLRAIQPQPQGQ